MAELTSNVVLLETGEGEVADGAKLRARLGREGVRDGNSDVVSLVAQTCEGICGGAELYGLELVTVGREGVADEAEEGDEGGGGDEGVDGTTAGKVGAKEGEAGGRGLERPFGWGDLGERDVGGGGGHEEGMCGGGKERLEWGGGLGAE